MIRQFSTAAAWLAAILARIRLGMAMAAMMRIIATTIRSSIREKPELAFLRLEAKRSGLDFLMRLAPLAILQQKEEEGFRLPNKLRFQTTTGAVTKPP